MNQNRKVLMPPVYAHASRCFSVVAVVLGGMLMASLLMGCKEGSFLERRIDNFTARYNAYYNANRSYQQSVRNLERAEEDQPIDLNRYLPVFTAPSGQSRSGDFGSVITKCADILRKHPRSKWVDDALLLIGKSYFYQSNFVGAEQKFREIIDLGGPLQDEARFWLARTLVGGESYEPAIAAVQESLERDDLDQKWQSYLYLALGDLYVQRREWNEAVTALEEGIPQVKDRDVAGRAQFLLGQVYETAQNYEKAVETYRKVQKNKPLYELSYAAQVSEVRVQGLYLDAPEALQKLRKMTRDDKNFSYLDNLDYLRGRILKRMGRGQETYGIYDDMLYPPSGTRPTALRGQVHYALGELYRDQFVDFDLAAAHFDTAASALRIDRSTQELYTPNAIRDVREQADVFKKFSDVAGRIARYDSLLYLGDLDEADFDSAITAVRAQLAREAAERQAEIERRRAEAAFRGTGGGQTGRGETGGLGRTASGGENKGRAGGSNRFGFLNYKDPQRAQEAFLQFQERWGERPLVPGWRREEIVNRVMQAEAEGGADSTGTPIRPTGIAGFLPPVDVSEVPRDSEAQARMLTNRAEARYELANVLFLAMSMADSAASWYRLVIEEDENEEVAQRALYALAEVNLALKDTLSADRIYREILNQENARAFGHRARERLGLPAQEPAPDSLRLAQMGYEAAYAQWQNGGYEPAFEQMLTLAVDYPTTEVVPKAMLAAGLIYTEWARQDSLALFEPIPLREDLFPADLHEAGLAEAMEKAKAEARRAAEARADSIAAAAPPAEANDAAAPTPSDAQAGLQGERDREAVQGNKHQQPNRAGLTSAQEAGMIRRAEAMAAQRRATQRADTSAALLTRRLMRRGRQDSTDLDPRSELERLKKEGQNSKPQDVEDEKLVRRVDDENIIKGRDEKPAVTEDENLAARRPPEKAPLPEEDETLVKRDAALEATEQPEEKTEILDEAVTQQTDSLAGVGNVGLFPDSAGTARALLSPDSTLSTIDSLAVAQAPPAVAADTADVEPVTYFIQGLIPQPLVLETLYASIEMHFSGTPYARRATRLKSALEDFKPKPPAPDSTAIADSLAALDALVVMDSLAVSDSLALPNPSVVTDTLGTRTTPVLPDSMETVPVGVDSLGNPLLPPPSPQPEPDSTMASADSSQVAPIYDVADPMPELYGGMEMLMSRFRYTEAANGVTGDVQVQVVVSERGRTIDPIVMDGPGGACDVEALRVVGLARFRPGRKDGQAVKVRMVLTIPCRPDGARPTSADQ